MLKTLRVATRSTFRTAASGREISKRFHSSNSSVPPSPESQSKESNEAQESQTSTSTATAASTQSPIAQEAQSLAAEGGFKTKTIRKSKIKKCISVKDQASTISNSSFTSKQFTQLPTVPSTQYLDTSSLKLEMLYGGYRPILAPIRRPVLKNTKRTTIPLSWNTSACKLENFDDFSNVPQFVVDKLVPFNAPPSPGNEIRLGQKSLKELKEQEMLSKEVLEFIKAFKN